LQIGHVFLLNTKFSHPLKVLFTKEHEIKPMVMGCFGLGLSRILMLTVNGLSINNEIRWPIKLAPYTVCILPPKAMISLIIHIY
jgi:prolyl-tRNA synthetase